MNKVVKANIYGRMTPPSVTAPKVAAAAAGGATVLDVGGDGGDFGILDKVWNALGEGIEVWTAEGGFGEMFVDMGEVHIHPET